MAPAAPISALMQNAQDMLGRQQQEEATLRAASFAASSALQEAQVSPDWLSFSLFCQFVAPALSLTSYLSIMWTNYLTNQDP